MAHISDHIKGVKRLLTSVAGTPSYDKTLDAQVQSLATAISGASFTLNEAASAAEELKGFPMEHHMRLASLISDRACAGEPKASRSSLQDYSDVGQYLSSDVGRCSKMPTSKLIVRSSSY